jgi:hypothetical protein
LSSTYRSDFITDERKLYLLFVPYNTKNLFSEMGFTNSAWLVKQCQAISAQDFFYKQKKEKYHSGISPFFFL